MTIETIGQALVALLAAGIGWLVVHRQNVRRDQIAKRRELRLQFLIEAYRRLEFVSNRPILHETSEDFERAIADIQLFGSSPQVELATRFASDFSKNGTAPLDPLLVELRQDLRDELLLEKIPPRIAFLRMTFSPNHRDGRPTSTSETSDRLPPPNASAGATPSK